MLWKVRFSGPGRPYITITFACTETEAIEQAAQYLEGLGVTADYVEYVKAINEYQ